MYFVLYRPENAGSKILSALPELLRTIYTKCRIKWVIISGVQASEVVGINEPLCIDLANRQTPPSPFTSAQSASTLESMHLPPPAQASIPTIDNPVFM